MKKRLLATLFLISIISIGSCQNNRNATNTKTKDNRVQDSILIFKTDTTKFYSLTSIDPKTGKWKPIISQKVNYHKIDTRDKSLTFFFKLKNQNDWDFKKMHYDSLSIKENGILFYYNSGYFVKTFLDTLHSKTITHVLDGDHYIRFTNLKQVENSELENLKLKKVANNTHQKQVYSNKQIQYDEFEYSDYWRKKAFKKIVNYLQRIMNNEKPKCIMISRSSYNPSIVKYIGNQGFQVKLYAEYDCKKNYINEAYFWINAYYLGHNKWHFELVDQKLID